MDAKDIKIVLPKYRYKTPPYNGIIENEFCPVFVARALSDPQPNPDEVAWWQWQPWEEFILAAENDSNDYSLFSGGYHGDISEDSPKYSWWCKDQLKQLKSHPLIQEYTKPISS